MFPAVAVKPLSWRIRDLLCHDASSMRREKHVPSVARFRC
jgi:hypothetical protein